jgi:hypothetical protein
MTFATRGEIVSSCLTIFYGILVVLFPLVLSIYLIKNFDVLDTPKMRSKIGSMYSKLYIKRGRSVIATLGIFYLKRLLIPVSVVYNSILIV